MDTSPEQFNIATSVVDTVVRIAETVKLRPSPNPDEVMFTQIVGFPEEAMQGGLFEHAITKTYIGANNIEIGGHKLSYIFSILQHFPTFGKSPSWTYISCSFIDNSASSPRVVQLDIMQMLKMHYDDDSPLAIFAGSALDAQNIQKDDYFIYRGGLTLFRKFKPEDTEHVAYSRFQFNKLQIEDYLRSFKNNGTNHKNINPKRLSPLVFAKEDLHIGYSFDLDPLVGISSLRKKQYDKVSDEELNVSPNDTKFVLNSTQNLLNLVETVTMPITNSDN